MHENRHEVHVDVLAYFEFFISKRHNPDAFFLSAEVLQSAAFTETTFEREKMTTLRQSRVLRYLRKCNSGSCTTTGIWLIKSDWRYEHQHASPSWKTMMSKRNPQAPQFANGTLGKPCQQWSVSATHLLLADDDYSGRIVNTAMKRRWRLGWCPFTVTSIFRIYYPVDAVLRFHDHQRWTAWKWTELWRRATCLNNEKKASGRSKNNDSEGRGGPNLGVKKLLNFTAKQLPLLMGQLSNSFIIQKKRSRESTWSKELMLLRVRLEKWKADHPGKTSDWEKNELTSVTYLSKESYTRMGIEE